MWDICIISRDLLIFRAVASSGIDDPSKNNREPGCTTVGRMRRNAVWTVHSLY